VSAAAEDLAAAGQGINHPRKAPPGHKPDLPALKPRRGVGRLLLTCLLLGQLRPCSSSPDCMPAFCVDPHSMETASYRRSAKEPPSKGSTEARKDRPSRQAATKRGQPLAAMTASIATTLPSSRSMRESVVSAWPICPGTVLPIEPSVNVARPEEILCDSSMIRKASRSFLVHLCRSGYFYAVLVSDIEASGGRTPDLAYMRVANDIASRIATGELAPGARLLSERDLAAFYGVAFHTVRHAIQILRERGLIVSVHGRGTFVTDPSDTSGSGA
jgi:GntR family transcriptional regulator